MLNFLHGMVVYSVFWIKHSHNTKSCHVVPLQQFSSPMHAHERGFLNMAMVHLQQQQRKFNHDFGGKIDMVSQSPRSMRADGSVGPEYSSALDG